MKINVFLKIIVAVSIIICVGCSDSQNDLDAELVEACRDGNVDKVKSLIKAGANPKATLGSQDGSLSFPISVMVTAAAHFEELAEKDIDPEEYFDGDKLSIASFERARKSKATAKDYDEIVSILNNASKEK